MNAEAPDLDEQRVLVAGPLAFAHRAVQQIVASGREIVVASSAAEAKRAHGAFAHGVFAYDLPDGSGIVLAAEMMLDDRIRHIRFVHPDEDTAPIAPETSGY